MVSADADATSDISVVVVQKNTSYAGWSNTSPSYHGVVNSGASVYPISLASTRSALSVLADYTVNPTIDIYVTVPEAVANGSVYVSYYNGYGVFVGGDNPDILFSWDSSIPGYYPRYSVGSTLGYTNAGTIQVNAPSSFSVAVDITRGGTDTSIRSGTATLVNTFAPNNTVPNTNGTGSTLVQPYYKSNSSSGKIVAFSMPSGPSFNATTCTWHFKFDSNDVSKCGVVSGTSSQYLHSAVFVPLVVYVPPYADSLTGKIGQIITYLTQIATWQSDIYSDMSTIIGYLHSGNTTVISALADIVSSIQTIEDGLNAVTGNQYASAIQYIEYYLSVVMADTDIMVNQLNNIISTLNNIANTIGAANTDAQDAVQNIEDVHDYESDIYSQANIDIGSTVISSFNFDLNTASGLARAGIDFTNLWSALRQWNVVYTFSMILTLAFTIIRFTRVSHRSKKSDKEQ